jgi:hypothetical protein
MTDLSKLRVSLTKHGAHKIAALLKAFSASAVLDMVEDKYDDIDIDRAQAAKNLSADDQGTVPSLWDEAKLLGNDAIEGLVLVAIIFSHKDLIDAMMKAGKGNMMGTVLRGQVIDGKAYTNLSCVLQELGFTTGHDESRVSYDLSRIFNTSGVPKLVRGLLSLKLKSAGWDGKNDLADELLALDLHKVFAVSPEYLKSWLQSKGLPPPPEEVTVEDEGAEFEFHFQSGHNPKKEGEVEHKTRKERAKARMLHNEIQTALYNYLALIHGKENVGTENCGVDVVVKLEDGCVFYEIKTDNSVVACIRQAIGQLLEYAYWPDKENAKRLVIVSQNGLTAKTKLYLEHLRTRFGMPIYYEQFDVNAHELVADS